MSEREKLIEALEDIRKALMTNDLDLLRYRYMENYQGISLRGETETRDLILEYYRPGASRMTTYEVREQQVEIFGRVGIICGTGYVQGVFGHDSFEHLMKFTDIFLHDRGRWRCYRSQATELTGPPPE